MFTADVNMIMNMTYTANIIISSRLLTIQLIDCSASRTLDQPKLKKTRSLVNIPEISTSTWIELMSKKH